MMRMLLLIVLFVLPAHTKSYPDEDPVRKKSLFTPPLHIPIYLSASFMELRTDHFHSGIDIKTQGVTGKRVYAIEKGYIARVKIATSGFGKAIYIRHPNGYTSVYGHLSKLSKEIQRLVIQEQYKKQSYSVDLFFSPAELPVHRGEIIGLSGNTGSSSGPHLHFEIRDSQTEHPVNPLKFSFPVKDTLSPVFYYLHVYPQAKGVLIDNSPAQKKYALTRKHNSFSVTVHQPIKITGPVSLGFDIQDFLNGSHNRCGIYDLRVILDGQVFFHASMDEFSYATTRDIDALMDYSEKITHGRNILRTYIMPNNRLNIYRKVTNHGVIEINDLSPHKVEVIASDVYGNSSTLKFNLVRVTPPLDHLNISSDHESKQLMLWNAENHVSLDRCDITIPKNALYDTLYFTASILPYVHHSLSPVYQIHSNTTPLQRPFIINIKPDDEASDLSAKMLLASVDNKGNLSAAGGAWKDGLVTGEVASFGKYTVTTDTVPPSIKPLFQENKRDFSKSTSIAFRIKDNFSGIRSYNGYIDGNWVLFEYEPKKDLLWYTFDPSRLDSGKVHRLKLEITDEKENSSTFEKDFYW